MPRKGNQPSTARRKEEGPPPSPDGTSSDAEPEPPTGGTENHAAAAGELVTRHHSVGARLGVSVPYPRQAVVVAHWPKAGVEV